jgi:hypothetical protein
MKTARISVQMDGGRTFRYEQTVMPGELSLLSSERSDVRSRAEFALLNRAVRVAQEDVRDVLSYEVEVTTHKPGFVYRAGVTATLTKELLHPSGKHGKVERCHSILRVANLVLPSRVRDEALDEWIDEVECAAAEKKPVLRRTLSIVFKSLPSLALRARLPRARREGGS